MKVNNSLKWFFVIVILLAAVAANIYFSAVSLAVRSAVGLLLLPGVLLLLLMTDQGKQAWQFSLSAINEMKKVTWPTKQNVLHVGTIVVVVVFLLGLFLWVIDSLFMSLITSIMSI